MGAAFSVNTLDLFSEPVHFSFKKKTYFKTTCGGMVSIILGIIFILYIFYVIDELVSRKIAKIADSRNIFENPSNITFTKDENFADKNIPFTNIGKNSIFYNAFGIYKKNLGGFYVSLTNENKKFIELEINQIAIDDRGSLSRKSLNYEPCRKFANYSESFQVLGLERMYCINDDFEVSGNVNQANSKSVEIKLKKCDNSTANLKGIICNSDALIKEFAKNIQFEWYFDNWILNTTSFEIQNVKTSNLEQKYWDILSDYTKKCTIPLGMDAIRLYNSYVPDFLFSGFTELNTLSIREFVTEISDLDYQGNLLDIRLAASDMQIVYERRYLDIFSQLATLGGMCDVLFLIGFIFVWHISSEKFNEELVNTFYNISDPDAKGEVILQSKLKVLENYGYVNYASDNERKAEKSKYNEFEEYIKHLYNFHRYQAIKVFYMNYVNEEGKKNFCGAKDFIGNNKKLIKKITF
jgi:hypothetical protein